MNFPSVAKKGKGSRMWKVECTTYVVLGLFFGSPKTKMHMRLYCTDLAKCALISLPYLFSSMPSRLPGSMSTMAEKEVFKKPSTSLIKNKHTPVKTILQDYKQVRLFQRLMAPLLKKTWLKGQRSRFSF